MHLFHYYYKLVIPGHAHLGWYKVMFSDISDLMFFLGQPKSCLSVAQIAKCSLHGFSGHSPKDNDFHAHSFKAVLT